MNKTCKYTFRSVHAFCYLSILYVLAWCKKVTFSECEIVSLVPVRHARVTLLKPCWRYLCWGKNFMTHHPHSEGIQNSHIPGLDLQFKRCSLRQNTFHSFLLYWNLSANLMILNVISGLLEHRFGNKCSWSHLPNIGLQCYIFRNKNPHSYRN